MSWQWRITQNLKRNWLVSSKLTWGIWRILTQTLKNLKNLHFNGLLLPKYIMFELRKVQRSNFWWHWRLMQNLKENWLVLPKMTWRIWQTFTRALESLKIGTFMASFYPKLKMYEFKICRGVMCHDNEEWCKNWRAIDLSVQNWHDEFWRICTRALKNLKNLHFNGLLLTKGYNVWPKESTEELCLVALKIEELSNFFVHRLKNSEFTLESKKAELNQNKNSKQPNGPDTVWKLYFTFEINE